MSIDDARRWFAEDLRVATGLRSSAVINAFAHVPREQFIGPSPWRVGMRIPEMGRDTAGYQTFDDDPCVLYHDVVAALDEEHEINNGQPSLWARSFDELAIKSGARILHLGCGTGYYTAVLAEIPSPNGSVVAIEIDDKLAGRARAALSAWPQVSIVCGDGAAAIRETYDTIVVSAGASHPLDVWLNALAPHGRLLFPLTFETPHSHRGTGAMLLITHEGKGSFAARFVMMVSFVHFRGGRDPEASDSLLDAFRKRNRETVKVRSLRREEHAQDDTCWLHGRNFCLSYREPAYASTGSA